MKSASFVVVATLFSAMSAISSPALAAPDPIHDTTGMTPQAICDELLKPNTMSDFTTRPVMVSIGSAVPTGNIRYVAVLPFQDRGAGTVSHSNVVVNGSAYRNGGSPNIWGGASATTTYADTERLHNVEEEVATTTSFNCEVTKQVGSGSTIEPNGLQTYGNSTQSIEWRSTSQQIWRSMGFPFVINNNPIYTLICISPNNTTKGKPGDWVGKHGVTAQQCVDLDKTSLNPVPSGNSPDSYVP